MSIQSTMFIAREEAIERITKIATLIQKRKYRDIEENSFEENFILKPFVDTFIPIDISNIEYWTNTMLENYMNKPFFRLSLFDNYIIED